MHKLEIMLMKLCAPNHLLIDKDGAPFQKRIILSFKLLAILLTILYPLTEFGASTYNIFLLPNGKAYSRALSVIIL